MSMQLGKYGYTYLEADEGAVDGEVGGVEDEEAGGREDVDEDGRGASEAAGDEPNTNYSDWPAQHGPFYKGDWLVSYYTAGQADVIQVDAAGYNKCDATNAISNYSKGRSYAFELNETKTYYFICSYGYRFGGTRLAIKTEKLPPPSPPAAAKDKSATATDSFFLDCLGPWISGVDLRKLSIEQRLIILPSEKNFRTSVNTAS
ncbi:hypothetical protein E2562_031167 [Oryza meyeriana var. granulata]|uniref:Phytocyanin domain-containing protein n=1 Tax=Oryza meyeriana var. granulata TaxID=110450 RepID=A0A6G1ECG0_9ORYZ|nr:hypothetical protein E2562_031167 [Oryza meyeriana var. granulata]